MARIPVTVLTGYLGAGKTTLLNRILAGDHGRRYAVIVNEFGEIGIDAELIVGSDEELFEMNNGCVCCTVRGDLIRTVQGLLARPGRPFDAIIVETTGLAAPGPVVQTFLADPLLHAGTTIDSVTTVVDALHIGRRLADSCEAAEQIAFADQIVLNKIDLADPGGLDLLEARLRRLNPWARIRRAQRAEVPLEQLLGLGGFDLARLGVLENEHGDGHEHRHAHEHEHEHDHEHCHDPGCTAEHPHGHLHEQGIHSVSLSCEAPLDGDALGRWLQALLAAQGERILRLKGILDLQGQAERWVVQGVHMLLESAAQRPWRDGERRQSRLVLIGRGLDAAELRAGLLACTTVAA